MDFSAKNRINSIVGCIYTGLDARIRRTYRYIRQRVQPFAENTFFLHMSGRTRLYFRGNWRTKRTKAASEGTAFFRITQEKSMIFSQKSKVESRKPQKKSPEGLIFDSFTAHSRDHPATIPRPLRTSLSRSGPIFGPV